MGISIYPYPYIGYGYGYGYGYGCVSGYGYGYGYRCVSVDVYVYHRPNLKLACNVGCHPTHSPPSPSTVRSRDHTVLYCTIVLYSTKIEKICRQTIKQTSKQT